jgi:hypothetical protein
MGAASKGKRGGTRQQKIAAQRAAVRSAQVRRRILLAGESSLRLVTCGSGGEGGVGDQAEAASA